MLLWNTACEYVISRKNICRKRKSAKGVGGNSNLMIYLGPQSNFLFYKRSLFDFEADSFAVCKTNV